MKAVTWQGRRDVQVQDAPEPVLQKATDAIIRVTTTNICGSDLHLYEPLAAFMEPGDVLGHEAMGIVEETGGDVGDVAVGDRVVIPFQIACGECWMCQQKLPTQCETTQVRQHDNGAALFGYSTLYGHVPGGQAQYLRVPHARFTTIKVPEGPPDERFVYLSDVLPTAWQAVAYAGVPKDGTVAVLGLGPIGQMSSRVARHHGIRVLGIDVDHDRLLRAERLGFEVLDLSVHGDAIVDVVRDLTDGRGPDAVIDAVGMEAHGSPGVAMLQRSTSILPDAIARPLMLRAGMDRMSALHTAIDMVRRGGTISIIGVYGGAMDPMPMIKLFDKQIQIRMGQANVKTWTDDILPLLEGADVLGVD
ncbi:MAG TPA: alcohol dehydrogenase catalytic domain-containing protein, partial [Actinomycetes bacterium]|nr:alcohol dehydrogenase catalytic domain-containing protein [Actinomycetes bacterium]